MSEFDDGGPAFPRAELEYKYFGDSEQVLRSAQSGMTLRDYFAAKAMQAVIVEVHKDVASFGSVQGMSAIADVAYGIADAMLEARDK